MSEPLRIFINGSPLDVAAGSDVGGALRCHDAALADRVAAGSAIVTDGRGIEVRTDQPVAAGAILRVVIRAKRGVETDADA